MLAAMNESAILLNNILDHGVRFECRRGAIATSGKIVRMDPRGNAEYERHLSLLLRELDHRFKNLVSNVRALARLTYEESDGLEGFYEAFDGRLQCLSRFQSFVGSNDKHVDLRELLAEEFLAYAMNLERDVAVDGPDIMVDQRAAQTLALAFHELVINAIKLGAVGAAPRHADVRWQVERRGGEDYLVLDWRQTGLRRDTAIETDNFGRRLIEEALPYELGGSARLVLSDDELRCTMEIPFHDRLRRADVAAISLLPGGAS